MERSGRGTGAGRRRLGAARLGGAAAIGILGQFVVDMRHGYFGAAQKFTAAGAFYSAVVAILALVGILAILKNLRSARLLALLLFGANILFFLPGLAADPIVAGGILAWSVVLLTRGLFPYTGRARGAAESPDVDPWTTRNGPAVRHLLAISLIATVVVVGFEAGDRFAARLTCLLLALLSLGLASPFLIGRLRAGRRWPLLPALLILAAIPAYGHPSLALAILGVGQVVLLSALVASGPDFRELARHFYGRPALLVLGSFAVLIALGTLALSFPAASVSGESIPAVDALFTATSASCVTGLVVLDTPGDFTWFGQAVILVLIQAGGLNIMVLSTFAAVLLGRGIGLRGQRALGEVLAVSPGRSAYPLIRFIVISTFAAEAVGAAILTADYAAHGFAPGRALWNGVFHSVSAFCNAGFALHSTSLARFDGDPVYLVTMIALITLGGLGFAVLAAAWSRLRGERQAHVATQVKLVLSVSAVLVAGGTVWYAIAEWNRTLAGLSPASKLLNSVFQSVTLRTAGFNSVSMGSLGASTMLMMLAFMWIGASPGGTGGGIKTTTAAVLVSAIPRLARGGGRVTLFGRRISLDTIYRSAAIAVTTSLVAFGALAVLLATQEMDFDVALFEVTSALGTVGLTIGGTAALDTIGKVVIVATMLLGRTGPLTLALLLGREADSKLVPPEARIMVG